MKLRAIVAGGFLLLVGLYVAGEVYRISSVAVTVALPAFFLAAACAAKGGKECGEGLLIAAALLLSGIGDLMGGLHRFVAQIIFFALAHAAYIAAFTRCFEWKLSPRLAIIPLVAIVATLLGTQILPHISDPVEKSAVALYIMIISLMASAAVTRGWAYAAAAALFLLSDSLIAWNRYMCRIPHATLWIMSTYYAAQLAFALRYLATRKPESGITL